MTKALQLIRLTYYVRIVFLLAILKFIPEFECRDAIPNLSSILVVLSEIFQLSENRESQDSNLGLLGERRKGNLCALPPLLPR